MTGMVDHATPFRRVGSPDLGVRRLRQGVAPEPMTWRWVLVHMVEETARHAGHADILRGRHDGATGR